MPQVSAEESSPAETGRTQWEKATAAVLRKSGRPVSEDAASVWDILGRTTLDGVEIPVLGVPRSAEPDPDRRGHRAAILQGVSADRSAGFDGWDNRTIVDDPSAERAAADALSDLENGATSLWLMVGRSGFPVDAVDRVLRDVYLDLAPVVIDCADDPLAAAEAFCAVLRRRGTTPVRGTTLGVDVLATAIRHSTRAAIELVAPVAELAVRHGLGGFVVDATAIHDAGGSDGQELGWAAAAGVEYLRLLTDPAGAALDVDSAASLLEFRYSATVEQFPTIAKLRAGRLVWQRICELSGVSDRLQGQRQHAVTSRPMMTRYDPWVNMLRGTVAAFAAGVGGATSVTVLPFDHAIGGASAFSRRIARNTSSLLTAEAHLSKVVDPAGGSYVVEELTEQLADAAWREFQRIDAAGGPSAELQDGTTRARLTAVAGRRDLDIARRRRAITGVSEFPNLHERLPDAPPRPRNDMPVHGYATPFEQMRDHPVERTVFLATMGSVAQHTARASFAANLLASGGIDTVTAGATSNAGEVMSSYAGEPVVCLCGSDSAYAGWGPALVNALRAAGATYIVLAGRPQSGTIPAQLIDDHCALDIDAVQFLIRVREEINK